MPITISRPLVHRLAKNRMGGLPMVTLRLWCRCLTLSDQMGETPEVCRISMHSVYWLRLTMMMTIVRTPLPRPLRQQLKLLQSLLQEPEWLPPKQTGWRLTQEQRDLLQRERRCFKCHKVGHVKARCRSAAATICSCSFKLLSPQSHLKGTQQSVAVATGGQNPSLRGAPPWRDKPVGNGDLPVQAAMLGVVGRPGVGINSWKIGSVQSQVSHCPGCDAVLLGGKAQWE